MDRFAQPFKRNDQMLEALPVGLIAFPDSGVSANLADKARKLGIPVWRHGAEVPRERRPSRITGCSRWGSRHSVQHYRMGGERRFPPFAGPQLGPRGSDSKPCFMVRAQ